MHTITVEHKLIKIVFDKNISNWTWDKGDIKYIVDSYKDHASIMLVPTTVQNYKALMAKYAASDDYIFTEEFLSAYKQELKTQQELENKRALLKEKLSLENINSRPDLLDYTNMPRPFAHQKLELEYAVRMPAFYSLDEMGLGKTRVAIERHLVLKNKLNKIDKTLVICPVSLMYNWYNEIAKWAPDSSSLIISGTKQQKIEELGIYKNKVDFFILNFEGVDSIQEELLNLVDSRTNIIIDEFIKIKNPAAKRSKNLIGICNKTEYIMGLCGTPVAQGSIDLFSPNLCIDKGRKFGISYERFIEKYFFRTGWKLVPKHSTAKEISEKLYENALRFTKAECLDIPDKMYIQIPIDLPPENQNVYNQMVSFAMAELQGKEVSAPIILVQLLRLSQITSGFLKTPDGKVLEFQEQPKLDAVSDILDNNNGTQVIIWSRFIRDIKAIANICMDKGISFGCLIGSEHGFDYDTETSNIDKNSPLGQLISLINPEKPYTIEALKKAYQQAVFNLHPDRNPNANIELLKKINGLYTSVNRFQNISLPKNIQAAKKYDIPSNLIGADSFTRQALVDKFQAGNIQVMIGTASTGGIGFNLTNAERVIYYSNDYSLINRSQSEDRAHRSGQTKKVQYYDIVARNTIDTAILDILLSKKSVADVITRDNVLKTMKGEKV